MEEATEKEREKQEREDAKKSPAEIAGMQIEEEKTPFHANTRKIVNDDGSLNLAQVSSASNGKNMLSAEEALE